MAEPGSRSLPEPVAAWKAWPRKLRAFSTVSVRRAHAPTIEALATSLKDLRDQARSREVLSDRIWNLWRAEGLAYAYADRCFEQVDFSSSEMPLETGPPVQCGLSMAAVLHLGFDVEQLEPWIRARADPRFVDFAFESLGLMLAAYEGDGFGRLVGLLGRLGVLRRYALDPADPARFLEKLPEPERRLAAHGYGRLLYFKHSTLTTTIEAIERRSFLPREAAIKGAVAAYVLVNAPDLQAIVSLYDSGEEAIVGGLDNVLSLIDWSVEALDLEGPWRGDARSRLEGLSRRATKRREAGVGPGMEA